MAAVSLVAAGCSVSPNELLGSESSDFGSTGKDSSELTRSADSDPDRESSGAEVDVGAFEPTFDEGACDESLPTSLEIDCGTVLVPSNWEQGSGEIELAVVVFRSSSNSDVGPIVNLEGGPGGHSLETIDFVVEDVVKPLLEIGDVVFFDQRGVGLSQPRLRCQELAELSREHEDDPGLDDDEATDEFYRTLEDCRNRLLDDGIALVDYNSINNAHDVEAIRIALGYEQWNLFGVSYGTKLALEVMRRHPEHVRTAILDSVYPPQVDSVSENPSTFLASLNKVVAACAEEPECAAEGDLGDRIRAVVADLEKDPLRVEIEDWISGETDDVFVTGDTLSGVVTSALYSPSQFVDLPEVIEQLENGDSDGIATFLSQDRTSERFFTSGMFYAIACQEEISFAKPDIVKAALPDDPFGLDDKFELASNTGLSAFETCAAFENGQAPATSNEAVTSDIPTLLMAGDFDPVTPTQWAELAAETLSNSHLVVSENGSHGLSGGDCGSSIVTEFLTAPDSKPDASCFDDEELTFLARSQQEVELEDFSFEVDDGKTLSSVRPEGWRVGSLDGDLYRDQSFLDPTVFFQLSADQNLVLGLESYVGQSDISLSDPTELTGAVGPIEPSELGRRWNRRSGSSGDTRAEWFETTIDGQPVQVILITSNEDYEANLEFVVLPALLDIDIS